jgi:hypothetical protein
MKGQLSKRANTKRKKKKKKKKKIKKNNLEQQSKVMDGLHVTCVMIAH